jgi:predicted Fe-Mo cluster-binding NifX family protein
MFDCFVHIHNKGGFIMKVCFPVCENHGVESGVFGHFGSAPLFLLVDSASAEVTVIGNGDRVHEHGACNPIAGLGGKEVDAVVVGGIGGGALMKLNSAGIRVFQAREGSVADNLALLGRNQLAEYLPGHSCGGHGHGGGCSH